MSLGLGKNTSSKSDTTIIVASADPGGIEKKCRAISNMMIEIFILLSSFGMWSRLSRRALHAVMTMPELTATDRRMSHVDEEDVEHRLGRSNHVLCRRDVLDNSVVELSTLPAVHGLVVFLIPIEHLRDFIAHCALPACPAVDALHEWVDVRPAAPAACDHLVSHQRHGWVAFL